MLLLLMGWGVASEDVDLPIAGEGEPVLAGERESYSAPQRNKIEAGKRENIQQV
jgi:hypothetical protein